MKNKLILVIFIGLLYMSVLPSFTADVTKITISSRYEERYTFIRGDNGEFWEPSEAAGAGASAPSRRYSEGS